MDYLSSSNTALNPPAYRDDSVKALSSASYTQPIIHPAEYTAFLNLMLSTIDTSTLSNNYFQYLAAKLPLLGLSFAVGAENFSFGNAQRETFQSQLPTSFETSSNEHSTQVINYSFNRGITRNEKHLLHELHTHFCVPLAHTLSYRQLLVQATRDRLTGLGNRAAFDEQITRMISQFQRHNSVFGLLVIDLDNFKQVNDSYGHQEGDSVLMVVAEQLNFALRDEDIAFRFGGDEFCCLLNEIDRMQLFTVAERLRNAIANHAFLSRHKVSVSVGATLVKRSDDKSSLFKRADTGVYQIKQARKDGVAIN
jgi:diguanylate cyclase (GGDEF)-like protein